MDEPCHDLARILQSRGGHTVCRDNRSVGMLICASSKASNGALHGVSFKVYKCGNQWCVETWLPFYYWIPQDLTAEEVAAICLSLLTRPTSMTTIDPDLVEIHGLVFASWEEVFLSRLDQEIEFLLTLVWQAQQLYCNRFGQYAVTVEQLRESGIMDESDSAGQADVLDNIPGGYKVYILSNSVAWFVIAESSLTLRSFQMDQDGTLKQRSC